MHDPRSIYQTDRGVEIQAVIADLRRSLRADGAGDGLDEWDVYDQSFRDLVRWSEQRGCFFEGQQPERAGGREHDLTLIPSDGDSPKAWLKFTKPSQAGYVIALDDDALRLEPALPLPYLERIALQNELFGALCVFVGVAGERHRPRIVTRQAHVEGEAATDQEIIEMMTVVMGFQRLPGYLFVGYAGSLSFIREDIAVFDMRPANVVRTGEGLIVPIDCIPVRLDGRGRGVLGAR